MSLFLETIFWIAAGLTVYTYAGYPLLVFLVSRLSLKQVARARYTPAVSVIIAAYNEERDIRAKLLNTLSIDYPTGDMEIIVVSDCSSDGTEAIVSEFADQGVKLVRQTERKGKTAAQNLGVEAARGEIILFSDATATYQTNVLIEMLPNFADPSVGCVAGRLVYRNDSGSSTGSGAQKYWNYETFVKESESRACSLIGVSGCLYAVRRSAYVPMYEEACSDFYICTMLFRQGLRTVYQPTAVCFEDTNKRAADEFAMRVRIISQTFADLWRNREIMNPLQSGFFGIQLLSHKLLRYMVPLFLTAMFLTSAVLAAGSRFFTVVFALQAAFYAAAIIDRVVQFGGVDLKVAALPRYFCIANLAAIAGFLKFVGGERYARWEPIRDQNAS